VSLQHAFTLGARNDAVWGLDYRSISDRAGQTSPLVTVLSSHFNSRLFSFFVQDELAVIPGRLFVTAGAKIEHNDFTGVEIQPNLRLRLKLSERQTLWAAESRAVRTPDQVEGRNVFGVTVGPPFTAPDGQLYLPTLFGNAQPESEVLHAHEIGYRIQAAARLSFDIASFYNQYRNLITFGPITALVPGDPNGIAVLPLMNLLTAETHGVELSATIAPTDAWRLIGGYSLLRGTVHGTPGTAAESLSVDGPQQQVTVRSCHDLSRRATLTGQLRYVDAIPGVRSYLTADVHVAYRTDAGLELTLTGQNLLDRQHAEQGSAFLETSSEVPRAVYARVSRQF